MYESVNLYIFSLFLLQAHFKSTDEDFIKFLSMAIIRTTVDDSSKYNLKSPSFEKKLNLLQTHFGDRRTLEMQVAALHGIQHVDFQLEHPKGELKVTDDWVHCLTVSRSLPLLQNYLRTCSPNCTI